MSCTCHQPTLVFPLVASVKIPNNIMTALRPHGTVWSLQFRSESNCREWMNDVWWLTYVSYDNDCHCQRSQKGLCSLAPNKHPTKIWYQRLVLSPVQVRSHPDPDQVTVQRKQCSAVSCVSQLCNVADNQRLHTLVIIWSGTFWLLVNIHDYDTYRYNQTSK